MKASKQLQRYADVLNQIRHFFAKRDCLEVITPVRIDAPASDPHTTSFSSHSKWLRTSPEFEMKRLLQANSGDIYQIGPVFRQSELGKRHRDEFTMLEWYRVEWDYCALLNEAGELLSYLLADVLAEESLHTIKYQDAFCKCFDIDPFVCTDEELQKLAVEQGLVRNRQAQSITRYEALDFLFEQMVSQSLLEHTFYAIKDFPPEQASFAKLHSDSYAERFEIFLGDMELANGYQELTDAKDYRSRIDHDNHVRQQLGLQTVGADEGFLDHLTRQSLPRCAGVSVGIERVLMCLLRTTDISQVRCELCP